MSAALWLFKFKLMEDVDTYLQDEQYSDICDEAERTVHYAS